MDVGHYDAKRVEICHDQVEVGNVGWSHPSEEGNRYENYAREHPLLMDIELLPASESEASYDQQQDDEMKQEIQIRLNPGFSS